MKKLLPACRRPLNYRVRKAATVALLIACSSTLSVGALSVASAHDGEEHPIAVVGVDVVNPRGFESIDDATVIIENGEITAFGPASETETPADAHIIDGAGKWMIPGLMDLHVHFGFGGSLVGAYEMTGDAGAEMEGKSPADFMYDLGLLLPEYSFEANLKRHARAGITTIMSPGDSLWTYGEMTGTRARAAKMEMGPRILLATLLSHPRLLPPSEEAVFPTPEDILSGEFETVVSTPEQGVATLQAYVEALKPDLQKIWFVDSKFIGEPEEPGDWKKLLPTVNAMVDEATRLGLKTGIDAIEAWRAKAVMPMGANLVHGVFFDEVDDEYISLMKEHGTQQMWTAIASERYFGAVAGHLTLVTEEILVSDPHVTAQMIDLRGGDTDALVIPAGGSRFDGMTLTEAMAAEPYTEEVDVAVRNLRRVHAAGIPVAMGTDAGIVGIPYGAAIYAEFEKYREAGMSDLDILTSATINSARYIELEDEIGSVTVGKRADLVLVSEDPSEDIMNAAKVVGLFRDGHYATADMLNDDTAFDVVTRLRNAYNLRDDKAFGALLLDDVVFVDEAGRRVTGRKAVVRKLGPARKAKGVRLRTDHVDTGSIVVQQERWPDGGDRNIRYEIEDKRISAIAILSKS
ncbi:MAG: amidohydrolase family protein [Pseudomonadota bacterium]